MSRTPIEIMLDQAEWTVVEGAAPSDDSLPYATHAGVLRFGDTELRCYRLNTGEAVFDADDVAKFFGGVVV